MNAVLTIIRKEFARFFGDKRLLFTTVLLPGLLIYAVYSATGSITKTITQPTATPVVCVRNMPQSLSPVLTPLFEFVPGEDGDDAVMQSIMEGDVDLLVVFPQDFDAAVEAGAQPLIKVYFNSGKTDSSSAYYTLTGVLDSYEQQIANAFNVNLPEEGVKYDLADEQSAAREILRMIVPMILVMLLFSGCISVVLESVAGEKERGTFATMLVTPVKRTYIAVGKIISLSVLSVLSGISGFVGLILSLPNMIAGMEGVSLSMYTFADYALIFFVIISTVLVLVSVLSIVSAFARSTKEANALLLPVMMLVLVCAFLSMFVPVTSTGMYFIPVLNSLLCISSIMAGAVSAVTFAVTICVNFVFTLMLAVVLAVMFNSEKIMFNS